MHNGVFSIPLAGLALDAPPESNSTAPLPREFVAGPENLLAAAALRPYLDGQTTPYSPLVLFGSHGSGKTHLAHGLADWWGRHFPTEEVLYLTGAQFAQDYARALEHGLHAWHERVRTVKLLVVDDLGQLCDKRASQQELVHTLDALADREAMVVATSRTIPAHMSTLIAPLRSRLSAGLVVGLSLPEKATRRALVEALAAARGLRLSRRSIRSLADTLNASVSGLKSAMSQLELEIAPQGEQLDEHRVREFVIHRSRASIPSLAEIARLTARQFGLKVSDLKSASRQQTLVRGRGVAMLLARQLTDKSFDQIGEFFGGRDHTTVLHGCRRVQRLLKQDRGTLAAVAELKRILTMS